MKYYQKLRTSSEKHPTIIPSKLNVISPVPEGVNESFPTHQVRIANNVMNLSYLLLELNVQNLYSQLFEIEMFE